MREVQCHRLLYHPSNQDGEWDDEERNLGARSDGDSHCQIHLVLHRDRYCRDVLHSIAHDRQDDQTDKGAAHTGLLAVPIDAVHQKLRKEGDEQGRNEQSQHRHGHRDGGFFLLLFFLIFIVDGVQTVTVVAVGGSLGGVRYPHVGLLVEDVSMRLQLEDEQLDVHEHEEDGSESGDQQDVFILHVVVLRKRGGQNQRDAAQRQQAHVGRGRRRIEGLLLVLHTAKEEAGAQHQEQVGEDGADHGGLHDADLVRQQGLHGDHDLYGVAEGGVDQPSDGLVGVQGQLLREVSQDGGERDHDEEVEPEDPRRVPLVDGGVPGERHEQKEDGDGLAQHYALEHLEGGGRKPGLFRSGRRCAVSLNLGRRAVLLEQRRALVGPALRQRIHAEFAGAGLLRCGGRRLHQARALGLVEPLLGRHLGVDAPDAALPLGLASADDGAAVGVAGGRHDAGLAALALDVVVLR
mmetsp:Transcript_10109/g.28814  ORF Transcript_10109/g.28814 Transcript_10109/m.28814 type:complete len:463 (+) Transcript_10109:307-1695(+)